MQCGLRACEECDLYICNVGIVLANPVAVATYYLWPSRRPLSLVWTVLSREMREKE
jgi:hypothetical protein